MATTVLDELRLPAPFVSYQCPCHHLDPRYENDESGDLSVDAVTDPPRSADILSLFPVARLYYCEHCHRICCPVCIQEEIACYYCPNCLFEVPTASVKAEKNRCGRNCFECPVCENTLNVVSMVDPATPSEPNSPTATAAGNTHYLTCGACRWDSLEIGMQFDRPTGLATQLQPLEEARKDVQEFENLRQHFEKVIKVKDTASTGPGGLLRGLSGGGLNLPSSLLATIPGLASFASLGRRSSTRVPRETKLERYSSSVEVLQDTEADWEYLLRSGSADVTSLQQRLHQPNDKVIDKKALYPQRIQLRTKRLKRCRKCEHIVVKPEHKAQSTRFNIKMMAMNYIPKITIAHPFPQSLQWNVASRVVLRFTNPLEVPVSIALATTQSLVGQNEGGDEHSDMTNCQVTLLAPNFTIDAAKDIWNYEDEATSDQASNVVGVHERAKNFTSIIVQVTPILPPSSSALTVPIQFALLVHVRPAEPALPALATAATAASDVDTKIGKRSVRPLAFWVAVGLGDL
ncbi:hypothetical protein PhCBS80983_g00660 [Powellomyces hirtus]|uniref:Dynactin subunit 4 n=1 Tax=Powellomyces hirtus TaxID=109895 RepID=A0A507EG13_9FUNG|nr:hypothetical protein PhCBS80983_g00660 [Powellomyces hirtus]